jgi:hypothetical protein
MLRNATMPSMEPANPAFVSPPRRELVKWQRQFRRLRIRRTGGFTARCSRVRIGVRSIEQFGTGDMEDQCKDGDDGECGEAQRRDVTRIDSALALRPHHTGAAHTRVSREADTHDAPPSDRRWRPEIAVTPVSRETSSFSSCRTQALPLPCGRAPACLCGQAVPGAVSW